MKNIFAAFSLVAALMIASPSHALFSPLADNKIPTTQWQVQYLGETQVDGLRVAVLLESIAQEMRIPTLITELPMGGEKEVTNAWRLTLVSIEQPKLRASFPLNRETAFVDGAPMKVFFTKSPSASGFNFVIRGMHDGRLHVQYVRTLGDEEASGEFQMIPAVQVM